MNPSFVALDFETATGFRNSACAIGIVSVENGIVTDEFVALIKPPNNDYWQQNISVHGIRPRDTVSALSFAALYPQIHQRIAGKILVAHNESFDRSVMKHTMELYGLNYGALNLAPKWECTLKIYRAKGYSPATLSACCSRQRISLNHHEALSDAKGCAQLYIKHLREQ